MWIFMLTESEGKVDGLGHFLAANRGRLPNV